MTSKLFSLFVTCPKGFEDLLLQELESFGVEDLSQTVAGASGQATLDKLYRIALYSRLANRVLLPLSKTSIESADDVYKAAKTINWAEHFAADASFAVDFSGTNRSITNTQFGALRIKDAVVDFWRERTGARPNVDKSQPDFRINARLHRGELTIALDFVGGSLHQRGYRQEQGVAPLKENLAAAILLRLRWPEIAKSSGALIDPMCGSGTFLLEAALMAADIPVGIYRREWSFCQWLTHNAELWNTIKSEAERAREKGLEKSLPPILGFDKHPPVLRAANGNIQRAGLVGQVTVAHNALSQLRCLPDWPAGVIVTNPPYGERLGEVEALKDTYFQLAKIAKEFFTGWTLAVFTGNPELAQHMRLRSIKRNKFFNGAIPCELLQYQLVAATESKLRDGVATDERPPNLTLTDGALMIANRLRKNSKSLKSWLVKTPTNCYRVYDADMPEYAAALDYYDGRWHLQEYAPPKNVDVNAAKKRFDELIAAVCHVFEVTPEQIAIKTRQRNKGDAQYEKLQTRTSRDFQVVEGKARFWINLETYLDTGLFLDHRPLRLRIAEEVTGKRFLNLFCYTASATVHAALAGATRTVSVDMSKTYLAWASRNFELNHIGEANNELVHNDCMKYLADCREGFDVIMLDPPSFSNSKRMDGVLDVQRDHVALIKRCMDILLPGGVLYFSNNLRTFKLDHDALSRFFIEDISLQTIDFDFSRNQKIHQCYRIKSGK